MSNTLPYTTTYNIEGLTNGNTSIEFTSSETTNYLSKKKTIDIVSSVEGSSSDDSWVYDIHRLNKFEYMENISTDLTVVEDIDSMFSEYTNKRTFSVTYCLDTFFSDSTIVEYNGIDNLYDNLKSNHSYYAHSVVYYSKNDLTTYDISSLDRSIYDSYTNYNFYKLFNNYYSSIDRSYISFHFKDGVTTSNASDIGYVHPNEVDMDLLCIINFNIYTVLPFISMSVGNIKIPVFKQNPTNDKNFSIDHTITKDEPIDFYISYEDSNDKVIIFYFPIKLNYLKNEIPSDMFINYILINDVKLEPDRSLINQYNNFLYRLSYIDENDW